MREWSDALIASDPGLSRLTGAAKVSLGIGAAIAAEYGFAQLAHPMWHSARAGVHLSAMAGVLLSAQHHGVTLIAIMLGSIIGMISSIAVNDVTPRAQAITMVGMPIPFMATLSISIELAPHRAIGLVGLALVTGFGTYLRKFAPRFGPRVIMYGILLFIGYFFGLIAAKEVPIGQMYWVAAILWLSVLVNFTLLIVVFDRVAAGALSRSGRSFSARARGVIAASAALLDSAELDASAPTRQTGRLARRLVALNEAAITIEAQLADPRVRLRQGDAAVLHDGLLELELHLENLARAITALSQPEAGLDLQLRARVRGWLSALAAGDTSEAAAYARDAVADEPTGVVPRTSNVVFATAAIVVELGRSLRRWQHHELLSASAAGEVDSTIAYESPVTLIAGNLAGSSKATQAVVAASTAKGLAARLHLDGPAVSAIQMTLAVGVASAVGSAVNERRYYWAVIAVFIIYMGANTTGEQVIRAVQRVVGTCVGIVLGSLLAHAIGPSTWSIAVIIPAMAFAVYFMRVNSGLMAVGITVTVSMLYVDLGEFSNGLLVDRLELTAIGAVIATLAALLIFPVSTGRVLRQAALQYLDALLDLVEGLSGTLHNQPDGERPGVIADPTRAARHLDDTLQQLLATARPLARYSFRRNDLQSNLQTFVASAHFARNLAADAGAGAVTGFGNTERAQLATALDIEADLVRGLHDTIDRLPTGADPRAVGSAGAPIVEAGRTLAGQGVAHSDPRQQFVRALFNLDGSLIQLGRQLTVI